MDDQLGLFHGVGIDPGKAGLSGSATGIPLGDVYLRGKNRIRRVRQMDSLGGPERARKSYARSAYRLEVRRVKEPDYPYNGALFDQPIKVVEFVKALESSDIEKMLILYLTSKNKLVCLQVFPGTIDRASIYPREIVKHAILSNAASVIIVHNHPSGDPTPSPEDKNLTRTIVESCKLVDMRVLDHIIIGTEGNYFSFAQAGMMPS